MRCGCGRSFRSSEIFCTSCGAARNLAAATPKSPASRFSRLRISIILIGGLALMASSLVSGVQQATSHWRLRSLGVASLHAQSPVDVSHFASLLPVAGFAIALLALCGMLAKKLFRNALMKAIAAVLLTVTGFQIAGYIAGAARNHTQNALAWRACDYCSPPYPSTVASSYLVVSALILTMATLAIFEARQANRRVGI